MKLLQLFYSNPNRSFYVREITRKIDEQINSVRRELANLLSVGIISSETTNNRLYYEVSQKYEYYEPLATIFGGKKKAKTTKNVQVETEDTVAIKTLGNVDMALFTGQFTRDETAGVDILIVGDVNQAKAQNYVTELEQKEGKELRYAVMDAKEFDYRKQVKDRFITAVLQAKKQVLIDKNKVLEEK